MQLKKGFSTGVLAALLALSPGLALAHSLWINVTDHAPAFRPRLGAVAKSYLGYGHRYPVHDFLSLDSLTEYALTAPDGHKTALKPADTLGFLVSDLHFKAPGHYLISVARQPGYYTMHLDNGTLRHKLGPKTGLQDVILSLYYEQYAKSLIQVGEAQGDAYQKPVGHRLEIIPLADPRTLRGDGGHFLPVKVLFNGQPARFCKVTATHSGFAANDDFAFATTADSEGIARIRLTHWGPWLIKANVRQAAPDDMRAQVDELNYTATLTLAVP